ncbi:P-loop containing nucleoside triphosphate hydrolase protein [Testicularia cyperi]|uniref:RNA helicase n=1 Tax=Testicularia cyperi TaxID=1882483 RepID=A0A317XWA6_9BASI|nr:P-loop containing nucleoside triphosphate hydrolase protein [Testicularia cyperi]
MSSAVSSPSGSPQKKKKKIKYANAPSQLLYGAIQSTLPSTSSKASSADGDATSSSPSKDDIAAWLQSNLRNVDPRISESRRQLPIWSGKDAIVEAVQKNDTVVILGETGSGKTTQIPQFLFEAGLARKSPVQIIGITQPRRVAATSLARRVAVEMGQPDPAIQDNKGKGKAHGAGLVGYSIRFEDRTSKATRIKFMTDGMVLREMIGDASNATRSRQAHNVRGQNDDSMADIIQAASMRSNLLLRYSVLIIDEAHERTLRTDQVLGLAKRIQRERKALRQAWIDRGRPETEPEITELKIVVMSATLDANRFADFFASSSTAISRSLRTSLLEAVKQANRKSEVPILYVKGRQHSVSMYHTEEAAQEWTDAALRTVLQIHISRPPGDILVFMTGQEEIETLAKSLELYSSELPAWAEHEGKQQPMSLMIAPLYAALGPSASTKVFGATPARTRKVVLATNIAETSITIPGIVYVIDCGLAKEKVYTPHTSVESLQTQEISQSAARQRAGRAGRERSGECYRLYTEEAFKALPLSTTPEIMRTDLTGAVLQLCAMDQDPYSFDWLDKPDAVGLQDAVLQLIQLGALVVKSVTSDSNTGSAPEDGSKKKRETESGLQFTLTVIGRRMAMLPVAPAYARSLIAAADMGPKVARQVRDMIAILSADRSILSDPSDPEKRDEANRAKQTFVHRSGDHGTLLNVLYAYLDEQESARALLKLRSRDQNGKTTNGAGAAANAEAREQIKAWCQNHFVHEKAVRNVIHIRRQLQQICRQQNIGCDDDIDHTNRTGKTKANKDKANGQSGANSEGARRRKMREGLYVTRKQGQSDIPTLRSDEEDYSDLLRCMLEGRFNNVALRTPAGTWKRIGGGQPFKIHPSSCLHASRLAQSNSSSSKNANGTAAGVGKFDALIFEELVFTSQNFARTVSRIEPSWIQEVSLRNQERRKSAMS